MVMTFAEYFKPGPTLPVTFHREEGGPEAVNLVPVYVTRQGPIQYPRYTEGELAFLREHPGAVWAICGNPNLRALEARAFLKSAWCQYGRTPAPKRKSGDWWANSMGGPDDAKERGAYAKPSEDFGTEVVRRLDGGRAEQDPGRGATLRPRPDGGGWG